MGTTEIKLAKKLANDLTTSPKSGAEIVAMLESGEIDTSAWNDIETYDPVAWLKELRNQERKQRGLGV